MAPRAAPKEVDVEALLREADAADAAARAALPTPEEERVIINAGMVHAWVGQIVTFGRYGFPACP